MPRLIDSYAATRPSQAKPTPTPTVTGRSGRFQIISGGSYRPTLNPAQTARSQRDKEAWQAQQAQQQQGQPPTPEWFDVPGWIGMGVGAATSTIDALANKGRSLPGVLGTAVSAGFLPFEAHAASAKAALGLLGWVEDQVISRPLSTAFQAGTYDNPLYRDGFQFSDLADMWSAAEKMSPAQAVNFEAGQWTRMAARTALGYSPLDQSVTWSPEELTDQAAPTAFPGFNPYDEEQVRLLKDNAWYNVGTGALDLGIQVAVGGKGVNMAWAGLKRAAGLTSRVKGVKDVAALDHEIERHLASNGEDWTPAGQMVDDLASNTDFGKALTNPLIARSTIPEKMASMTVATSDPQLIRALVRADRGDRTAIFWLLQKAPHKVWQMSDMTPKFAQEVLDRGHLAYGPDQAPFLNRVFDSALEEEQFFTNARNAFLAADRETGAWAGTTRTNVTMPLGTVGAPGLRRIGDVAGKAQSKVADVSLAIGRGEAGERWATVNLGKIGGTIPVTRLLQWAGGRKPTGMVSLSRQRPGDAIMEFNAWLDSLWWTRGTRSFDILRGNERLTYTGPQYRAEVASRIGNAVGSDDIGRVAAEVKAIESEMTSSLFLRYEGMDAERVAATVKGWQDARDIDVSRIQRDGFFFDEQGSRILVDPLFQRQLADNMRLLDLRDLDKTVRKAAGGPGGVGATVAGGVESVLDFVQKAWRTETLFKPGYTPKNSIVEPWVSSLLAHGTIAAPDGILATTGNVLVNTRNRVMSATYAVTDATGRVVQRIPGLRRALGDSYAKVAKDIETANVRRVELENEYGRLQAELDYAADGGKSPAWKREYEPQIKLRMAEVRSELDATYESLNRIDPMWRNDPRYPTYLDMREEVALLDDVLSRPPTEALAMLDDRINVVHTAAASVGAEAAAEAAGRLSRSRSLLRSSISGDQSMVEATDDLWGGWTGQGKYVSVNEEVSLDDYIYETALAADTRLAQIESVAQAGGNVDDLTAELEWLDQQLDTAVAYRRDPAAMRDDFLAALADDVPVFHEAPIYSQAATADLARLEALADGIRAAQGSSVHKNVSPRVNDRGENVVGMVPTATLAAMRGNPVDEARVAALADEIAAGGEGIREPVAIEFDPQRGVATVGEGNHRVAAAQRLGIEHVPAYGTRRDLPPPEGPPEPIAVNEIEPGVLASEDGRYTFREDEDGGWAVYDSEAATAAPGAKVPADLDRWLPVGLSGADEPDVWLADDWSIQRQDEGDFGVYPPYASEPVARADTLEEAKARAVEEGGPTPIGAPEEPPRPAGEWTETAGENGAPQWSSNNWVIQDNGEEFGDIRFTVYRPFEDEAWETAPTLAEAQQKARGPLEEERPGTRSPQAPEDVIAPPRTVGEKIGMGDIPRAAPDVTPLTWKRKQAGEYQALDEDGSPSSWSLRKEKDGWVMLDGGTPVGEPFRLLRDGQDALAYQRQTAPRRRGQEELEALAESEFDWSPSGPSEWRLGDYRIKRSGGGWESIEPVGDGVSEPVVTWFATMDEAITHVEQRFVLSGGEPGITPGVTYTRARGQERQVEGSHNVRAEEEATTEDILSLLDSPVDQGVTEGLPTDGYIGTYGTLDEARTAVGSPTSLPYEEMGRTVADVTPTPTLTGMMGEPRWATETTPESVLGPIEAPAAEEAISAAYATARAKVEKAKQALARNRKAQNSPDMVEEMTERQQELEAALADVNSTLSARTQRLAALEAKRDRYRQRALGGTRALVWRQNGERLERMNYLDRRKSRQYERQWRANRQALAAGRPEDVVPLPDDIIVTEGLFDESTFGEAIRAEFGAQATYQATIDPARTGAATSERFARAGGTRQIGRDDPDYWSELAYVVNRQIRQDLIGQQALQGADADAIAAMLDTPAGRKYAEQMGWLDDEGALAPTLRAAKARTPQEVKEGQSLIDMEDITHADGIESIPLEMRRLIDQYLPRSAVLDPEMIAAYRRRGYALPDNANVQHLAAAKEVTPNELRQVLSGLEDLSPVLAGELEFIASNRLRRAASRGLDKVWNNLAAKPEERVARFPGGQRYFEQFLAEDMEFIRQQGGALSVEQVNGLRQAASARALYEVERTYYNIRRYSNPVYALRTIIGFPGAYFNSIYRMARLTARRPGNAMVLTGAYQNALTLFAVDAEGNRIEDGDWRKADGIIVALPGPLKNISPDGDRITASLASWDFVSQTPSFSWFVGIPAQSIMAAKPDMNEVLKEVLSPGAYKALFRYGPTQKNDFTVGPVVLDPLVSGYVKDAITAIQGEGDDFVQATTQYLQYLSAEWERNGSDPANKPTIEQAAKMAADHYKMRALTKWAMAGGYKIDTAGQFMRDEWYKIQAKHKNDLTAARDEMLRKHGESAVWYTTSSSNYRAFIYPSVDGYRRLTENEALVSRLFDIDPKDPDVVGLIGADSSGDYDPAVRTWMGDYRIPGDSAPLRSKLTPQQWQARAEAGQSWTVYNAERAKLDAIMVKYGWKSLNAKGAARVKEAWDAWEADFRADPKNANWLTEEKKRDYSGASKTIRGFEAIVNDKPFMDKYGKSSFWTTVRRYTTERKDAVMALSRAGTPETRRLVKEEWNFYVRKEFLPADKVFAGIYTQRLDEYDLGE